MNGTFYDLKLGYVDVPERVFEGTTTIPRRSFYRASVMRGPFAAHPVAPLSEFQKIHVESPTIYEWPIGGGDPFLLMDPKLALLEAMKMLIRTIEKSES